MRRRSRIGHRGAVLVEYALLLTFFAVPVMAGITMAGVRLLEGYRSAREVILRPVP